ncbi:MAG: hypothetical protein WA966_11840 [Ornithinimicrobium sp.]
MKLDHQSTDEGPLVGGQRLGELGDVGPRVWPAAHRRLHRISGRWCDWSTIAAEPGQRVVQGACRNPTLAGVFAGCGVQGGEHDVLHHQTRDEAKRETVIVEVVLGLGVLVLANEPR